MAFLSIFSEVTAPTGLWTWLILDVFSFIADYGWRIIFFTFCLKVLLSPIDIYQRYKARKNQLITLKIKPQMDKLQKMYANDQKLLAQKQMELNKKAGISYFSSCLPAIITLVIFITLFSLGLQPISQYQNFRQYEQLYDTYTEYTNDALVEKRYAEKHDEEIAEAIAAETENKAVLRERVSDELKDEIAQKAYDDVVTAKYVEIYADEYAKVYAALSEKTDAYKEKAKKQLAAEKGQKAYDDSFNASISAYTYDQYCALPKEERKAILEDAERARTQAINDFNQKADANDTEAVLEISTRALANIALDAEKEVRKTAESAVMEEAAKAKAAALSEYDKEAHAVEIEVRTAAKIIKNAEQTVRNKAIDVAQQKVKDVYETEVKMSFLWIKNIWNADTLMAKPINNLADFKKNIGNYANPGHGVDADKLSDMLNSGKYELVMGKLLNDPEYNSENGYFILPALTIILSIAMQLLSYRQQKESGQMTAQSESSSKIMMFVMPIMMAFFAFSYTAAFALYLVMSYVVSIAIALIGTLVVKLADRKAAKNMVTEVQRYGRPDFSDRKNDGAANENNTNGGKK